MVSGVMIHFGSCGLGVSHLDWFTEWVGLLSKIHCQVDLVIECVELRVG